MQTRGRTGVVAVLTLLLSSCFNEPVVEKLEIDFREPEAVLVTASVQINDDAVEGSPLAARLARLRDDLVVERDFWSTRFGIVAPRDDEYRRERANGKISSVTRRALVSRDELARMLTGFAELSFVSAARWDEISVGVAKSDRATSAEKRIVDSKLDDWAWQYAIHVKATARLLHYIDANRDRAPYLVARVLVREGLPEKYRQEKLTEDEEEIVDLVNDSRTALLGPLSEQDATAYTFEEMTRRVYDPFPAEVTVDVPGEILECEGFVCTADRIARVPKLSLTGSMPRLQRWVSPDPLTVQSSSEDLDPQIDEFLAQPRTIATVLPSGVEVRAVIDTLLKPASTYRLRWRTAPDV